MAWTSAQKKAMDIRDKTLIISAAAGSGKTAVLINRIIDLLVGSDNPNDPREPIDITRLLIVTFTKAAALELRQRISKGLLEAIAQNPGNTNLFKQLTKLGSAHISTIDSFYSDVVKKHAEKNDIPTSLRLADDSEILPIRQRIMNEVLDMGYDGAFDDLDGIKGVTFPNYKGATPFTAFADSISEMRSDSKTWETLTDLYEKLLSHTKSYGFILDCEDAYVKATISDLFNTEHGKTLRKHLIDNVELMVTFLTDACREMATDRAISIYTYDLNFCCELLSMLKFQSYVEVRNKILSYSPQSLNDFKKGPEAPNRKWYNDYRNKFVKEKLKDFKERYFSADCSEGALVDYSARSAVICRILYAILKKFDELYSKEKISRGICEFSDIKKWAYSILVTTDGSPSSAALEIAENFDAVYIDEYQDVDPVQDTIFRVISKPRGRFMVGDVKQSIYKFRGAAPSLFMNYRSDFAQVDVDSDTLPDSDDCTVFMSSNFRCDETVIKFANTVCSHIFKISNGELKYKDEDDLIFAKDGTDEYVPHQPIPVNVVLLEKSKASASENDNESFSNLEAGYIAFEIQRLINSEYKAPYRDKKGNIITEKITPKDIAILSRGKKFLKKVSKELDKLGIPNTGEKGSDIFDDPNVLLTLSLLHTIDNPHKDIYTVGTIMSPIFGFSADDILMLRPKKATGSVYDDICKYSEKNDNALSAKCKYVIKILDELRKQSASLSSDKIIRHVFSKFGLLSKSDDNASSKEALLAFYENARAYEGDEFKGLYSYLCYVDNMIENEQTPSVSSKSDNAVKLMTIHGSKGLEFPVCFVASTYSSFNESDKRDTILYSPDLGISAEMLDADGLGKITSPYQNALTIEIDNKNIEEEMRLLYVALTRARERLYITALPQGSVENVTSLADFYARYKSRGAVMDSNNYINWILSSLYLSSDKDFFNITTLTDQDITDINELELPEECEESSSESLENPINEKLEAEINERFNFTYPYHHISDLPAKLSVSKLSPNVLDRSTGEEELSLDSVEFKLPDIYVPSFTDKEDDKKISPAEKGTATHTFLQFCDFDNVKSHSVESELDRLVQDKFISERMKMAVDEKQLEAFFESCLFKEIESAKRVWREQRFNILLPAHAFTDNKDKKTALKDEKLLVQGVIDIFFETADGKLVLCDYKTDRLTSAEIKNKDLASKKLNDAHATQLSYYAEALKNMFGKYPDKVLIYSLPLGDTVEINTAPIL